MNKRLGFITGSSDQVHKLNPVIQFHSVQSHKFRSYNHGGYAISIIQS